MRCLAIVVAIALLTSCTGTQNTEYRLYTPMTAKNYVAPRFSEKKGVGLQYDHCEDLARVGASWSYNWHPHSFCGGIPMIFQPSRTGDYDTPLSGDGKYLLVFNELDQYRWYYTPAQAARSWRSIEKAFPDRLLVGPAVSHLGIAWLQEFHDVYKDLYGKEPRWQALAIHCYMNSYEGCRAVVQEIIDLADEWEVAEVWVTEFAFNPEWEWGQGDMDGAARFVRWMEDNPRVARYAWFTNRTSGEEEWAGRWATLFRYDTGHITEWGTWYSQRGKE